MLQSADQQTWWLAIFLFLIAATCWFLAARYHLLGLELYEPWADLLWSIHGWFVLVPSENVLASMTFTIALVDHASASVVGHETECAAACVTLVATFVVTSSRASMQLATNKVPFQV